MTKILYLIASSRDFPKLRGRPLMYTIRGTVYATPMTSDGDLDIGAAINVPRESDADELLQKAVFRDANGEQRNVWTLSPTEAALRKEAYLKGTEYAQVPTELPAEVIRSQASVVLTTEELLAMLKERGVTLEPEPEKQPTPKRGAKAQPPQPIEPQVFSPPPITVATPATDID